MGIIDANGSRKALFNAFRIYGWMPIIRKKSISSSKELKTMASSDDKNATIVVWNNDNRPYDINILLKELPFENGTIEIYKIDEDNNSYYETLKDNLIPVYVESETFENKCFTIHTSIKEKGIIFLRVVSDSFKDNDSKGYKPKIIHTHYWSPTHNDSSPYSYFDSKSFSSFLSINL